MSGRSREVALRPVEEGDLSALFEHQRDPESVAMAAVPARDEEAFRAHWRRTLGDEKVLVRAVVADGRLAGQVLSFELAGERVVGYWLGREHWGRGIATAALEQFLRVETTRPLRAHVAVHNAASARVLEKCGFLPVDRLVGDDGVEEVVLELRGHERLEPPAHGVGER